MKQVCDHILLHTEGRDMQEASNGWKLFVAMPGMIMNNTVRRRAGRKQREVRATPDPYERGSKGSTWATSRDSYTTTSLPADPLSDDDNTHQAHRNRTSMI